MALPEVPTVTLERADHVFPPSVRLGDGRVFPPLSWGPSEYVRPDLLDRKALCGGAFCTQSRALQNGSSLSV